MQDIDTPEDWATAEHLARVDAETSFLHGLEPAELRSALREAVAGSRSILPEALVRVAVKAHEGGDRSMLNLAFEPLIKTVTPLLISQAWGMTEEDRKD